MNCEADLNAGRLDDCPEVRCGRDAIYRAWIEPCYGCQVQTELESCKGHPVCLDHGAGLRERRLSDRAPLTASGDRATVIPGLVRICSLEDA